MFVKNSAQRPSSYDGAEEIMTAAEERQLIERGYLKVMAHIVIGIAFVNGLIEWIGLLEPDLVGAGVNGMAESIQT